MSGAAVERNWKAIARNRVAVSLCVGAILFSVLLTFRSYSYSDSFTLYDATVGTEEGLLSLQIPLVRRIPSEPSSTEWATYSRGKSSWETDGNAAKATLRDWMSMLDTVRCEGAMFGGFGYWKGAWQSPSRPGPFIVMFLPIWFAVLTGSMFIALVCWRRVRFRLATILIVMTGVCLALGLLKATT
jgi:hypothetical protein